MAHEVQADRFISFFLSLFITLSYVLLSGSFILLCLLRYGTLTFQQRVKQKDETIAKYMQLLQQSREDMVEMNHRHEEELRVMQQKIHSNTDMAFNKFKDAARELINNQVSARTITAQQVSNF